MDLNRSFNNDRQIEWSLREMCLDRIQTGSDHIPLDPFFDFHLRMLVKSLDFGIRLTWAFILSLVGKCGNTLLSQKRYQHGLGLQPSPCSCWRVTARRFRPWIREKYCQGFIAVSPLRGYDREEDVRLPCTSSFSYL